MAVIPTVTKLIKIEDTKAKTFFKELMATGVDFQVLDPIELGQDWEAVNYNLQTSETTQLQADLDKVNLVLSKNQPKSGFLASFEDRRLASTWQQITKVGQKHHEIVNVIDLIIEYNKLQEVQAKTDLILEKNKSLQTIVAKNITFSESEFSDYLYSIMDELKERNPDIIRNAAIPAVKIEEVESHSFIIVSEEDQDLITDYLKSKSYGEVHTGEDFALSVARKIQQIRQEISSYLDSSDKLTDQAREMFACLSAYLESEIRSINACNKVFSLEENSKAQFVFVNSTIKDQDKLEQVMQLNNFSSQTVDWEGDIVDWSNPGALKSFQGVAQSIGTIDNKEADPTSFVAIFFMIFFGFCLGDALYGLIISAFTGYFLFIKTVKPGFKNIFNIFFYSGLIATLIGVVTNSWAGDFFNSSFFKLLIGMDKDSASTPVNDILKNFQLIDVINASADAPINQAVSSVSPIILMMLVALLIGFLNQLIGYIFRLRTNFAYRNWNIVLGQLAWILFLSVGIAWIAINALDPSLVQPVTWLLFASLAILFIFNQATSFGGKLLGFLLGPRGIYGVLQLGANLISYVRIFAIGLTGSIIATIVNLLAGLLYEAGGPILGLVLGILVLIIGHVFNFVLSVFGAYINPLRLTYVEFMPGFFEGRARQIEKVDTEFTHLKVVPSTNS